MKKLTTLSIIILLSALYLKAQLQLVTSSEESLGAVMLKNSGYKYYSLNLTSNVLKLMNTDFSVWKTISLPVTSGYYLYNIDYVSENLFTTNGKLCLLYIIYKYDATNYYYTYEIRIIDESGTNLLTVPNGTYYDIQQVDENGTQTFMVYLYDYSAVPYFRGTKMYSLPNQATGLEKTQPAILPLITKAFPNPATDYVNISCNIPVSAANAKFELFDNRGALLKTEQLHNDQKTVTINTSSFPSGVYFYRIVNTETIITTSKIIVNH